MPVAPYLSIEFKKTSVRLSLVFFLFLSMKQCLRPWHELQDDERLNCLLVAWVPSVVPGWELSFARWAAANWYPLRYLCYWPFLSKTSTTVVSTIKIVKVVNYVPTCSTATGGRSARRGLAENIQHYYTLPRFDVEHRHTNFPQITALFWFSRSDVCDTLTSRGWQCHYSYPIKICLSVYWSWITRFRSGLVIALSAGDKWKLPKKHKNMHILLFAKENAGEIKSDPPMPKP